MKTWSLALIAVLFITTTSFAATAPQPSPPPSPTPTSTIGGGVKNPWRAPFKLAVAEPAKFIGE